MRNVVSVLMLASIGLACSMPPAIHRDPDADDAAPAQTNFLNRIQNLALSGQLFDFKATASTLGLAFAESTREVKLPYPECYDGTHATAHVTTISVVGHSWFHPLATGEGNIAVPAFTINPATVSGDPKFDYTIYRNLHCTESRRIRDRTEAELTFAGLPAFICLTVERLRTELPNIRLVEATDGVFLMTLTGRQGDDSGTALTFQFRAGTRCALSAHVIQDQQDGLRYRRALLRYQNCSALSDRDFCSTHPNIGWSDSAAIGQMMLQADAHCGTVDSLYRQEPRSGIVPPPSLERHSFRTSPCADP